MSLATHWSGYFAFAAVPLISTMSVTAAAEPSADAVANALARASLLRRFFPSQ